MAELEVGSIGQKAWERMVEGAIDRGWQWAWSKLRKITHQHGGIMPSEMMAFGSLLLERGVFSVFESGRRNGYSTECLIRFTGPDLIEVTSYEIAPIEEVDQRLKKLDPTHLHDRHLEKGDGVQGILNELEACANENRPYTAVLIDGPKGIPAFELLDKIQPHVSFVAIHDLHKTIEGGKPNISRQLCEGRVCYFCEGEEFAETWGWMDEHAWKRGGYTNRNDMTKHSSSLGLFPGGRLFG